MSEEFHEEYEELKNIYLIIYLAYQLKTFEIRIEREIQNLIS